MELIAVGQRMMGRIQLRNRVIETTLLSELGPRLASWRENAELMHHTHPHM